MNRGCRQSSWSSARSLWICLSTTVLSATWSTPPERVEDLLARDHPPGVGGKQVQQALLERGQVQLRRTGAHGALQDVDIEVAELDHRHERQRIAVRPAQER